MTAARRLAAILAADVVGYSRLMGEDEAGTAKIVRERREAAAPIVRAFGGRLVKTTGDGVLLEFPSVVAAVECAVAIQKMMAERNATLPEAKRILYRVGVNLGDILIEGDDILGDGVNVAARLEGICEPGGVYVSGSAYEHVRGRIEAKFADLGEQTLKNIALPVRAYALSPEAIAAAKVETPEPATEVAAAPPPAADAPKSSGGWARWPALAAALALALLAAGALAWRAGYASRFLAASVDDKLANAPRLSIVVLPFENLSGDKDQDYFADGITDDLTTDLSHLSNSFVIARNTAFTYKGKPVDAKEIGKELGVRYLLEGSVRRLGEKVEVNAQLISTETGAHAWADRFEGERSKLGELQVDIVARLARMLGIELAKAEALRSMRERPNNPDAADLAMRSRARYYENSYGDKSINSKVIDLSQRALALDPQNESAMDDLAMALNDRVSGQWSDDPARDLARADKVADSALALHPDDARAHMAKAEIFSNKHQWQAAISQAEATLADDPNYAHAYAERGFYDLFLGHPEEGFAGVETALRLSPRDPVVWVWQFYMCALHAQLAQWEQAIEWCDKSVTAAPAVWYPYLYLAAANAWAGHDKEAKDAVAQLQKIYPGFTVQTWAGIPWTDDPTASAQGQRVIEGLRKAGVPEGEKKTN